ncbi:hypothetical protein C9439_01185 [archaeon SCG-AAA382B04]|nr:hypothetical protein C9439_01185 [archaeon SCG-AAA382B04]
MQINLFRIGKRWMFKEYLSEEAFKELSEFYSSEDYRFEFQTKTNLKEAREVLEENGYETKLIENIKQYCVVKDKYSERRDILKKSVYNETIEDKIVFVMKDKGAVEEAIALGAQPLNKTEIEPLF